MSDTAKEPVYVTVSALDAGHITLPDYLFVTGADPEARTTVPSLAFLIQHPSSPILRSDSNVTNLVFDLGVKRDLTGYTLTQQEHVAERQPIITDLDCAASLRWGKNASKTDEEDSGKKELLLDPEKDIDYVILSHVHWDHIGTPSDFLNSTFVVGSGTLDLLKNGAGPLYPAELFHGDELPFSRTVELPPAPAPTSHDGGHSHSHGHEHGSSHNTAPIHTFPLPAATATLPPSSQNWKWKPFHSFPRTLDFFGDSSVLIIDSPGHIFGHVNLLLRTGPSKYVYLGGDCCHDPRILAGEKEIAEYDDGKGGKRSVHVDTELAKRTLVEIEGGVRGLREGGGNEAGVDVEFVLAHDAGWRERNPERFWPGKL